MQPGEFIRELKEVLKKREKQSYGLDLLETMLEVSHGPWLDIGGVGNLQGPCMYECKSECWAEVLHGPERMILILNHAS